MMSDMPEPENYLRYFGSNLKIDVESSSIVT
jgi:hypothetical protein